MPKALALLALLCLSISTLAMYDGNTKVIKLTTDNFRSKVLNSNQMWFVEFYAPWCGHCQRLAPEYEKLAKAAEGIINIGAVDMTTDQSVGAPYDVRGFPTLKFFGHDKNKAIDYNGDRSFNDMLSFIFRQSKDAAEQRLRSKPSSSSSGRSSYGGSTSDGEVIVLTDSNFDDVLMKSEDMWIVEFYAPWCGHCKKLEPEWKETANRLGDQVKVAKVDATVESRLAQQFSISGYPTIKLFPSGKKSYSNVEDYNGARDVSSITTWALEKKASTRPVLKVEQMTNEKLFNDYCANIKGVCLIAFLPHIYDTTADERNNQIEILQEIQKINRANPVASLWSQGGDQYEFEEILGLGSGYPSLVAISVNKMKYSIMRGSFSKKNIETYVNALLQGREPLFNLNRVPPVKQVSAWDGLDHQPSYSSSDDDL